MCLWKLNNIEEGREQVTMTREKATRERYEQYNIIMNVCWLAGSCSVRVVVVVVIESRPREMVGGRVRGEGHKEGEPTESEQNVEGMLKVMAKVEVRREEGCQQRRSRLIADESESSR